SLIRHSVPFYWRSCSVASFSVEQSEDDAMSLDANVTRRGMLAIGAGGLAIGAVAATAAPEIKSAPSPEGAKLDSGRAPVPIAFLMDDHATMIDFAGPWEVF